MSTASNALRANIKTILETPWNTRKGQVVPKTEDIALTDGAVRIEATYLYADLRDSTLLAKRYNPEFAAKVIRMYLQGSVAVIRSQKGHIRSFDGDRVMGVFIGGSRRNSAVAAALRINWLVDNGINPLLRERAENKKSTEWQVAHGIGIDDGETFIVRGGARDNNDLISIGKAPNIAAKLSGAHGLPPIVITNRVHSVLREVNLKSDAGKKMWKGPRRANVGPYADTIFTSGFRREP